MIEQLSSIVQTNDITTLRKKEILQICYKITSLYPNGNLNLEEYCAKRYIQLVESERVMMPFTNGRAIFLHPYSETRFRQQIITHELGHVVLGHCSAETADPLGIHDKEAEYFRDAIFPECDIQFLVVFSDMIRKHLRERHQRNYLKWSKDSDTYKDILVWNLL